MLTTCQCFPRSGQIRMRKHSTLWGELLRSQPSVERSDHTWCPKLRQPKCELHTPRRRLGSDDVGQRQPEALLSTKEHSVKMKVETESSKQCLLLPHESHSKKQQAHRSKKTQSLKKKGVGRAGVGVGKPVTHTPQRESKHCIRSLMLAQACSPSPATRITSFCPALSSDLAASMLQAKSKEIARCCRKVFTTVNTEREKHKVAPQN